MDNSDGIFVAKIFTLSTAGSDKFIDQSLIEAISSLYNDFISEGSSQLNLKYNY